MNKESVRASGVGTELAKLTKSWSDTVSEAAKTVIATWKNALKAEAPARPTAPVRAASTPSRAPAASPVVSPAMEHRPPVAGTSIPEVVKPVTNDRKRDVIIAKLAAAMASVLDEAPDMELTMDAVEAMAQHVEAALHAQFERDEHAHKTKFLQLLRSLRDATNPSLRLRVMVGHLAPAELVQLSATELAPEQVQKEIQELKSYNKEASKMRKPQQQVTTQFGACGKCKHPKTSYFMMQTRSADEPMTIFISCVNCGHSWRK